MFYNKLTSSLKLFPVYPQCILYINALIIVQRSHFLHFRLSPCHLFGYIKAQISPYPAYGEPKQDRCNRVQLGGIPSMHTSSH